jgi:hypothetical protein
VLRPGDPYGVSGPVRMVATGSEVYLAWLSVDHELVLVNVSRNGGKDFTGVDVLTETTPNLPDLYGPDLAAVSNHAHVVWSLDKHEVFPASEVVDGVTTDAGRSFHTVSLSGLRVGAREARAAAVRLQRFGDSTVYVTWKDDKYISLSRSSNSGGTFEGVRVLGNAAPGFYNLQIVVVAAE